MVFPSRIEIDLNCIVNRGFPNISGPIHHTSGIDCNVLKKKLAPCFPYIPRDKTNQGSDGGLGFRDLNTFNLALLGKQAWRLIHEPNSYWAKLIKARYFPNCDFINAVAGHRPSWGWIILLEGREVIKENIRHQVFNGHNTKIWQDRWLLPPHQGYVVPLNTVPLNASQLVSEILDGQTRTWNTQALAQYVSQDTIKLISEVPIGNLHREDRIVWPWNKSGLYSVKSGYNLQVVSASYIGGYNRSSHVIERGVWKDIWASPTLPKVKFFLWRMMVRALPTKLNLYRRRIISSPFCPICNQASSVHGRKNKNPTTDLAASSQELDPITHDYLAGQIQDI
ncbi:PREDICTED: reverse mRNAase [Prunus dulcis]|uniref:PREDICTED: reverse mRNAase n=1 Tax=Prunus dulcis TaxID=3755 RepID=A0A5E4EI28_PRUDU|nr:PREDICTED: reverse mRNAase [Prunus dulcis]